MNVNLCESPFGYFLNIYQPHRFTITNIVTYLCPIYKFDPCTGPWGNKCTLTWPCGWHINPMKLAHVVNNEKSHVIKYKHNNCLTTKYDQQIDDIYYFEHKRDYKDHNK